MYRDIYRWYPPQRGFRQIRPFLIVFGFFFLMGIPMLYFGLIGPGLAVMGMGLAFYALLLPNAAAWGRKYGLGEEGILLKTATKEMIIPYGDIASATLLSKDGSKKVMEELYRPAVEAERQMDMKGWLRSNRRVGGIIRYLSVPVTGTETRRGNSRNITAYSVNPKTELLLLRFKSGQALLISPVEGKKFFLGLLNKGVSSQPFRPGEALPREGRTGEKATSGGFKKVVRVSILINMILALVLVGYFVVYPRVAEKAPSSSSPEGTAQAEGAARIPPPPHTIWIDDHTFGFGIPKASLPEMERRGGVTANLFKSHAAPRMINLLEAAGEIPEGSTEREELIEYLGEFLLLHSRMLFLGEETTEDGVILVIFQVEQTEMRSSVASLLRNF